MDMDIFKNCYTIYINIISKVFQNCYIIYFPIPKLLYNL